MKTPRTVSLVAVSIMLYVLTHTTAFATASDNLLLNPGFEEVSGGRPVGWQYDRWVSDRQTVDFYLTDVHTKSGRYAVVIESAEPDDAKVMQTIVVEPNSLYHLSCWVKAKGIPTDKKGANLSALGILETSESLYDTANQWRQLHLYGKTGSEQTELTFTLRLGGYGSLNKGLAAFDDCRAQKIEQAPPTAKVLSLSPITPKKAFRPSTNYLLWGFIASLLYAVAVLFITRRLGANGWTVDSRLVYGAIALSLITKTVLAASTTGFEVDLNTYKAWSEFLVQEGFARFYYSGHFVDYPPLYMYVFYLLGKLRQVLGIDMNSQAFVLMLKMPPLIAEFLSALLIIKIASEAKTNTNLTTLAVATFVFNPAVTIDSALWGQVDSVLALLMALSLVSLVANRIVVASVFFTLAALTKPQALILSPIFIAYFLENRQRKAFAMSLLTSCLIVAMVLVPFSLPQGPQWFFALFKKALAQYPYATLNAFNLYALLGHNWSVIDTKLILPFHAWGFIAITLISLTTAYLYLRSKRPEKALYLAVFLVLSVFMFSVKMHERYMIPIFLLIALLYVQRPDRMLLYLLTALTFTNTVNLAYTLGLSHEGVYHIGNDDLIMRSLSFVNLITYGVFVKWLLDSLFDRKPLKSSEPKRALEVKVKSKHRGGVQAMAHLTIANVSLDRRDLLIVLILVFTFSVLYLHRLGATVAPQSYWQPKVAGEAFYIDFGKPQEVSRLYLYFGLGAATYRVDQSNDFLNWQTVTKIEQKEVFQWKAYHLNFKGRYLSFVIEQPSGQLFELALFDGQNRPLRGFKAQPLSVDKRTIGKVDDLFDEQYTVPDRPNYLNSTYFDEIYYARTAYEILQGLEPYENTHPPLGKLFMAGSVRLFGMTPFGWRFAGVVAGVTLIALMYLTGRALFDSKVAGLTSALLIGLDFMTFVQSRIATIDVFAVLFVVAMYYFMLRFYLASAIKQDLAVAYLALSGVFFGLGVATKWLCLYAGVGLAVIYFYFLKRQFLNKTAFSKTDARPYSLTRYLLYGVCFFVLVPMVIYLMSYMPIRLPQTEGFDLVAVLQHQLDMYHYHKSVKGSHPFASTWWQWPIIKKPMWLYMGVELPPDKAESIVSMGNPAVWWVGSLAMLWLIVLVFLKRLDNLFALFVVLGFLSNYLPWLLVPREVYIYHFFASVPFLVLATVYLLHSGLSKRVPYVNLVYLAILTGLFCLFYPILSGMTVTKAYMMDYLRWFDSWVFFVP